MVLGRSVGADLRAATSLIREVAAQERGTHPMTRIFMKMPHDLFKLTTADENVTYSRFEGG